MSIHAMNARNQIRGKIREVVCGDVLSEIEVETPVGMVSSVITTGALNEIGLHVGSDVIASFKATEVFLAIL